MRLREIGSAIFQMFFRNRKRGLWISVLLIVVSCVFCGWMRIDRHLQQREFIRLAKASSMHIDVVATPSEPISRNHCVEIVESSFHPFSYFENGPLLFGDEVSLISIDGTQTTRAADLITRLDAFPKLQSLGIKDVHLHDREVGIIIELSFLIGLDVSGTNISAASLLDSQSLNTLQYLRMSGCRLKCQSFIELIAKCPNLRVLHGDSTGIDREWSKPQSPSLTMNLEWLWLADADAFCFLANPKIEWHVEHITVEGVDLDECFVTAMKDLSGLKSINLFHVTGDLELLAILSEVEGVESIGIYDSAIPANVVNRLAETDGLRELTVSVIPTEKHLLESMPSSLKLKIRNYHVEE